MAVFRCDLLDFRTNTHAHTYIRTSSVYTKHTHSYYTYDTVLFMLRCREGCGMGGVLVHIKVCNAIHA